MRVAFVRLPWLVGLVVVLAATGCTFGGGSAAAPGRSSDRITLEEIEASGVPTAWELVSRLRPNWLRGRGSPDLRGSSPVLPVVYVAGVRQGGIETLRGILRSGVREMRYLDAITATTRWGEGHAGGVIEVQLRNR